MKTNIKKLCSTLFLSLIVLTVGASCVISTPLPPTLSPADVQGTAVAQAWLAMTMTQLSMPTATQTPIPPTPTPTATFTPLPTMPLIPTLEPPTLPAVATTYPCNDVPPVKPRGDTVRVQFLNKTDSSLNLLFGMIRENSLNECGTYHFELNRYDQPEVTVLAGCYWGYALVASPPSIPQTASRLCVTDKSKVYQIWITKDLIAFMDHPMPVATQTIIKVPTKTPTAEFASDPTQVALGTPGKLCNNFSFDPAAVDVTIVDGVSMMPGQDFVKTWKIKNTGICPWGVGYSLVYAGYVDKMGGMPVPFGTLVAVGQGIDVSVKFKAPMKVGEYTSAWQMANADGVPFGKALLVKINVEDSKIGTSTLKATDTNISALTQTPNPTQIFQAAFEEVDRQFEKTFSANIAFNSPKQMEKEATTSVELILSPSVSSPTLAAQVMKRGDFVASTANPDTFIAPSGSINTIETEQIEITQYIKAELKSRDPEALTVTDMLDSKQLASLDKPTTWRWSVTAKKEGKHTLELIISQLIRQDDKETWHEVETYKTDIVVEVTVADRVKSWNWFSIISAIAAIGAIVGSIIGVWKWLDERKKKAAESKPPAPVRRIK